MNRLLKLETEMLRLIAAQEEKPVARDETLDFERLHMASSAETAWLLAEARGVDAQLAACACCVHDIGRILTGKQAGHAEAGYLPVQDFLRACGLFSEAEIQAMALAVRNHSSKTVIGTPLEEIVKDADVIACWHYGYPFDRPEKKQRYDAWREGRPLVL